MWNTSCIIDKICIHWLVIDRNLQDLATAKRNINWPDRSNATKDVSERGIQTSFFELYDNTKLCLIPSIYSEAFIRFSPCHKRCKLKNCLVTTKEPSDMETATKGLNKAKQRRIIWSSLLPVCFNVGVC